MKTSFIICVALTHASLLANYSGKWSHARIKFEGFLFNVKEKIQLHVHSNNFTE